MSNKKFDEKYIISEYNKGRTQKDIATELNTYNTSIRRVLLRNNVKLRGGSEAQASIKTNPFETLNSNTMYWLGILATDGNISSGSRNRINLTSKDLDLLKQYVTFLNNKVKIGKYMNNTYNIYEYYVNFSSKKVKEYLISLGITPKKSYDLKVNFNLTWDFIRGCFDGDGHVKIKGKYRYFHITTASKSFLNQLLEYFKINNFHPTVKTYYSNTGTELYVLNLFKQKEIKRLYDLLYNNAEFFLERKRSKLGT